MTMTDNAGSLAIGTVTTWAGTTRVTATTKGVRQVWLPDWHTGEATAPLAHDATPIYAIMEQGTTAAAEHLQHALRELAEYFAGERREFTVVLDITGPAFFQTVWAAVARVPYGATRSYLEIAKMVGQPEATRAVGAANGANPVAPLVPCHRIVGSDGKLTGYGPGLPLKERLLVMEGAKPASVADFSGWIARQSASGEADLLLGIRQTGTVCRATCARAAAYRTRANRVFTTLADAQSAGFLPCHHCQPSQPALLVLEGMG